MSRALAATVLEYLREKAVGAATDRELLRRFATDRDEAAFAEVVERHGPMVLRVCRRTLGDAHEAEDVCQSVFLLLARRAGSAGWRESVAGWLYTAALNHARRARDAAGCRAAREKKIAAREPSGPDGELSARELLAALDEELSRLPEGCRVALVLCYLEGLTRDEAARRLGSPLGTLKSRVERGRELLRERLERRGLSLSALLLAEGAAPAVLPQALVAGIVRAAPVPATGGVGLTKASLALLLAGRVIAATAMTRPAGPPAATTPSARPGDPLPPGAIARLGSHGMHAVAAWMVAAMPDGKTILSVNHRGFQAGFATLWDLRTGEPTRRFDVPLLPRGVLSPDGTVLFGVDEGERRLVCFDVPTGKPAWPEITAMNPVDAAALSRDGATLAVATEGGQLRLWDVSARKETRSWDLPREPWRLLAFSPDGRTIVGASHEGTLRLWDTADGREKRSIELKVQPWALTFAPDGKTFALAVAGENAIRLYDADGGGVRRLAIAPSAWCLAFSPDGAKLAAAEALNLEHPDLPAPGARVWDVKTGRELSRFPVAGGWINAIAFSRDGRKLLTGGEGLRVLDAATGQPVPPTTDDPRGYVRAAVFSRDGRTVATGHGDRETRLWDLATGRTTRRLGVGYPLAFSPDGRTLATTGGGGDVRFWDAATATDVGRVRPAGGSSRGFAYAPDGRSFLTSHYILSTDGKTYPGPVRFWDAATKAEVAGPALVTSGPVAFLPDGKRLVSVEPEPGGEAGVARLWDVATRQEVRRFAVPPITRFQLSPDGGTLVGAHTPLGSAYVRGPLHFVDLPTGKSWAFELPEDVPFHAFGFPMKYSPDGRLVAYAAKGGTVALWEVAAGQVRRRLRGHEAAVMSLAFSPDGTRLVSGSHDTTAVVWDVTGLTGVKRPAVALTGQELAKLWEALAGDAAKADEAMILLAASPAQARPFLRGRLKSAAVDAKRLARLIEQLDSESFQEREDATRELERMGDLARPALLKELEGVPSPEARRRIEPLTRLTASPVASPARLRELRAVEVLERIGAKEILAALAKGAPGARLTRDAAAALGRLPAR